MGSDFNSWCVKYEEYHNEKTLKRSRIESGIRIKLKKQVADFFKSIRNHS